MTSITGQENRWCVAGEILMDNANSILTESNVLTMTDAMQIDFSAVTDVDTAALSLMMEWQRRAIASNNKITFTHLPQSLASLATLYGVTDFISISAH